MYNIRPILKDGRRLGQLTGTKADSGFLNLFLRQRLHHEGQMGFGVIRDHPLVEALIEDEDPELWLYYGKTVIARTIFVRAFDDWVQGKNLATIISMGEIGLLNRFPCAHPAGTPNRTMFTGVPLETVARTIVEYNCGVSSLSDPDMILVPSEFLITPGVDTATGPLVDFNCFGKTVLEALRKLVEQHGGQFKLTHMGHRKWQFDFRWPRFIADGPSQVFSLERKNMVRPILDHDRTLHRSHLFVGGRNTGQKRDFEVVSQPSGFYSAMYVNGSNAADLSAFGTEKLVENRTQETFSFEVSDPTLVDLGEVWKAKYRTLDEDHLIIGREIRVNREGSLISIDTERWNYGAESGSGG